MTQKTSWEGTLTKALRKKGVKGAYTRYTNRQKKQGLEVVIPKDKWLEVRTPSGALKKIEPKYHNYNGNEKSASAIYNAKIKKAFLKRLRRK